MGSCRSSIHFCRSFLFWWTVCGVLSWSVVITDSFSLQRNVFRSHPSGQQREEWAWSVISSIPRKDYSHSARAKSLRSSIPREQYGANIRITRGEDRDDEPINAIVRQDMLPPSRISLPRISLPYGLTLQAIGWTVALILALAEFLVDDPADFLNGREIGYNIVDAAIPLTPTDVVAVTIGEVSAGAVAPFVSLLVVSVLSEALPTTRDLGQAVADADFLVSIAATQPLLLGLGVPPGISKALGGALALLPSQAVKGAARSRDEWVREELEKELEEELAHQFSIPNPFEKEPEPAPHIESTFVIELFSDLLKWLGYGVMCIRWDGALDYLPHVQECAAFGILANVGAQAYMDWMNLCFLTDAEQEKVQSRPFHEWKSIYLAQGICGATLFGLYEGVQEPATRLVSFLLQD
uniref:Uncharacterized protein n=1 Tax=Amphora coffeiformis TaxID=265554 RepID=A0A7S3KZ39_9STRA|mmetsp:Transcript_11418/g.21826  ORF Transcript_11418/g.21826 Transcript_11418/m.21826 type:complete len:410 (+) Transcript_11418:142-1371(+)